MGMIPRPQIGLVKAAIPLAIPIPIEYLYFINELLESNVINLIEKKQVRVIKKPNIPTADAIF